MRCGATWRARTSRCGCTSCAGAIGAYPAGEFPPGFARELNERYRARLAGETLMVNELYVSLVYRPQPTAVGAAALKLFGRAESDTARAELAESLEACAKLRSPGAARA